MEYKLDKIAEELKSRSDGTLRENYEEFVRETLSCISLFLREGVDIKIEKHEDEVRILAIYPSGIESCILFYDKKTNTSNFMRLASPPDPYDVLSEAIWRGVELQRRDRNLFQVVSPLMKLINEEGLSVDIPGKGKITLIAKEDVPLFEKYFLPVIEEYQDYSSRN